MTHSLVAAALAASLLAPAAVALGQPVVVDLRNPRPRDLKSTVFTVTGTQDFRVDAIGAESAANRGTFSWITAMWSRADERRREPWMGDAWILDLTSRKVVWELSQAATTRGDRNTRVFSGTVRLPAGTYEAFYAAFPSTYVQTEGDPGAMQRFMNWLADEGFDDFKLTMQGQAQILGGAEAERARQEFAAGAIVALRGDGGERFSQTGFILDRPTELEIYAVGEARENAEFDAGWIINADTRQPLWKLTWRESARAGGAEKNRMARITKTLPAGRYAAFYATDDSHDASSWNSPPPRDPHGWGLFVRAAESARAAVKTFTYDHVPATATIAALTKIGDDESRTRGFTLAEAADVRVYALGEGSGGRMFDYGWIAHAGTGEKVWEMRFAETEHAGGDAKNRLVDRTIRLEKGDYVLHYVSDDSHAYDDWNASAPRDPARWGITVLRSRLQN